MTRDAKPFQLNHLLLLNAATLIICTSAVIARYMNISPKLAIYSRSGIALIGLTIFLMLKERKISIKGEDLFNLMVSGVMLTVHWLLYFYALEQTSVAIGVITIFTYPIWTVLLEPLFLKTKFDPINLLIAIIILFGIYLLVPTAPSSKLLWGIASGVLSAVAYSIRNLYSKKIILKYSGFTVIWFQVLIVVVLLLPFVSFSEYETMALHWPMLLILGLFTTAVGHGFMVQSLKYFSVSQAGILASLQPLYATLMGMYFLKEYPSGNVVLGGFIVVSMVAVEVVRTTRQ